MEMRYFAVGFKGWVEVRQAKKPPKKVESEVEREGERSIRVGPTYHELMEYYQKMNVYYKECATLRVKREAPYPIPPSYPEGSTRVEKQKQKLSNIVYEGGRVVGQITTRTFSRLLGIMVKVGVMVELQPEQFQLLKQKGKLNV